MKVFLDTNVLIAASVLQHPHFLRADAILQACQARELNGVVHAHSLLEYHSAITQLPKGLAVPSAQVSVLLEEGILAHVELVSMSPDEIRAVQKRAGDLALVGGIIYDLSHLAVAEREGVDRFYTFNTGHFQAICPASFAKRIVAP